MRDRPTNCRQCGLKFTNDALMQAGARHQTMKHGSAEAQRWVDEQLQSYHDDNHGEDN